MVKKQGGGRRYKAAAAALADADGSKGSHVSPAGPALAGPAPPKHLQRKIARKVGFLDKVAASSKALSVQQAGVSKKSGRKKASVALDTMNTLSGVLDEVKADVLKAAGQDSAGGKGSKGQGGQHFGQGVKSAKARSAVRTVEAPRLQQVMQHPVFQKDPIAAITNHLKNTLPPAPEKRAGQGKGAKPASRAEIKRLARQRKREQKEDAMVDD